ncbi:hypothetical protein C2G38_2197234 [Gigaspora rosea]|uniref:Ion transport domain-containing protein n=1 Tax=Gigaspora rosea TaxID=44941 RepID=A0A397UY52_9GLOM|nr:hypothetical protein C2G38_2197234 [Gigaspora rosea]
MEELENSEKKETIIFFEEEPHIISEIYVSKDGKYIITYDQFNDSLLGWIIDENDVRTDNEIGIFKIERQQDDRDKNLLFKISSIKTKISMIVFDDRGYEIVDLRTKHKIECPSQFYNTKPEFLEFTSIDELIIFVEEEQIMYFYLVNFKENKWRKKMSLKIRTFMERISFVGNFDFVEEMDRIVRVISPDSNSTCIYLITNNGMLLLDRETKTIEIRITFDPDFKLVTGKIEIVKTDKTNTVQKKEKKRIINVKSIRTGLVVRTFAIQSLESGEEDNEKWYIIRSFDCLYIIAFINTKILLLNIANGRKYVITNDLNEEIKVIINENLSNFNIFTINAPDNTLFGIQDNKILKKNFRNLDFGKFFYNQNFEAHIWDSYLNIQEPYVNLYSFSPDIQELKRVKQLPVDAIKRRSCENELLKWSWKSPEYKIEVGECTDLMMEIINNTDLIINTGEELCIFHFDLNLKSVTLQYYWRIFSKNENSFIPFNLENALFLPRTDLFNSCKSLSTNQQLLGLWIGTIKGDKFSFAAYGEDLMICFIHFRATFIVLDILEKWIKWFIESPRENFHFLKLIIILYPELYKSFPEQMKKFHDTLKFSLDKEILFGNIDLYHIVLVVPLPEFTSYPKKYNPFKEFFYRPLSNPFIESCNVDIYDSLGWNDSLNEIAQNSLIFAVIFLGLWHLFFEIRCLIWDPLRYILDPWNYFDLGAFILPIITSYCMFQNNAFRWLISIANLLVCLKFILYFRVLESFGAYYAIIIGVAKAIFAFLVMIILIVASFGLAFYTLLHPSSSVNYDQLGNQSSDENNPWSFASSYYQVYDNGTIGSDPILIAKPDENEDMFAKISTSLFAIYEYFTVEIELFYLLPFQRRWQSWFPNMIYYFVPASEISKVVDENIKDSEQNAKKFISENKALLDLVQLNLK